MIVPPEDEEIDALADWVETSALASETNSVSKGDVETVLEAGARDDPQELADEIWSEIERRSQLASSAADHLRIDSIPYPLVLTTSRVEWKSVPSSKCYKFQLLLAMQGHYPEKYRIAKAEWNRAAAAFERLTATALEGYFGGTVIRIGAPREPPMPDGFWECVDKITELTRERGADGDRKNPRVQDKQIDVFAWRPFGDGRAGQVLLVAQCAAGKDWVDKSRIPLEVWRDYIAWIHQPVAALAIPFVHRDGYNGANTWREVSLNHTAILLDRIRITAAALTSPARGRAEAELDTWDGPLRSTLRFTE